MKRVTLIFVLSASCLASCATSKAPVDDPGALEKAAAEKPLAEPVDRPVGTVAVVKPSDWGKGFVLVRPLSKSVRVRVGTVLESHGKDGRSTARMVRSAENNRRFFVADIESGSPEVGELVVALPEAPGMEKTESGGAADTAFWEEFDPDERPTLPPLTEAEVEAMEP